MVNPTQFLDFGKNIVIYHYYYHISGECEIVINNGFLKEKCQEVKDVFTVFKCASTGEFYLFGVDNKYFLTNACSEDPHNYQTCGLMPKDIISNNQVLCQQIVCPVIRNTSSSRWRVGSFSVRELCDGPDIAIFAICKPKITYELCHILTNEQTPIATTNDHMEIQGNYECDNICHITDCSDESLCNGFQYGIFCKKNKIRNYVKISKICDYIFDCDDFSDEKNCTRDASRIQVERADNCHKTGEIDHVIPISNYTRCGPLEQLVPVARSYCKDFKDHYNCSDPLRGVLRCAVNGYPSTVSSEVLCRQPSSLCDDAMDIQCEEASKYCRVHKHLLCNGVQDCDDGSDEGKSKCEDILQAKCLRR